MNMRDDGGFPPPVNGPEEQAVIDGMRPLDLAPILAREAAATEGPWEATYEEGDWDMPGGFSVCGGRLFLLVDSADAEFIAHAREDIPRMADEIERLTRIIAEAKEYRRAVRGETDRDPSDVSPRELDRILNEETA